MPAQAPALVDAIAQQDLQTLGQLLRTQRKALRVAAGSVARAANMSRQTLHRIEQGEPSVTMGAYLNALRALGLELRVVDAARPVPSMPPAVLPLKSTATPPLPAHEPTDIVRLSDYPQLKLLAWHRQGEAMTGAEALALYERNWRHIDPAGLGPVERELIARLAARHGQGALLV